MPEPQPDEPLRLSTSDLNQFTRALRQDWPIPPEVKRGILQAAINVVLPDDDALLPTAIEPEPPATRDRVKLAAMRVIAQFGRLTIDQQRLDLAREKLATNRDEATIDPVGGIDPEVAEAALKVLNAVHPPPAPEHPADEP